ncbi:MAG: hypothetical protein JXQ23_05310 [Clostridia bacterium]|nr:hypothetical protein [Clostridia bacterium]
MDNNKLLFEKKLIANHKKNCIRYFITVDPASFLQEEKANYGIKIEKNDQETYQLNNQFHSYQEAKDILSTLAKYKVTPVICKDVIEDLLKR